MIVTDMNTETEIRIRRYRRNLADSGGGYICFGIWTVIKIFMTATMNQNFLADIMEEITSQVSFAPDDPEIFDDGAFQALIRMVTLVVLAVIALVAFLIHLYVGESAIRYSKGKKKTKVFLVVCAILILFSLGSIPSYFTFDETVPKSYEDKGIVPTIVDLTVVFLLFDIIYSVIRIDSLIKQKKDQESV